MFLWYIRNIKNEVKKNLDEELLQFDGVEGGAKYLI